jgi:hypothetical protein
MNVARICLKSFFIIQIWFLLFELLKQSMGDQKLEHSGQDQDYICYFSNE